MLNLSFGLSPFFFVCNYAYVSAFFSSFYFEKSCIGFSFLFLNPFDSLVDLDVSDSFLSLLEKLEKGGFVLRRKERNLFKVLLSYDD